MKENGWGHFYCESEVTDGPFDGPTDGWRDQRTDGGTNGRTHPLIEMRGASKNCLTCGASKLTH